MIFRENLAGGENNFQSDTVFEVRAEFSENRDTDADVDVVEDSVDVTNIDDSTACVAVAGNQDEYQSVGTVGERRNISSGSDVAYDDTQNMSDSVTECTSDINLCMFCNKSRKRFRRREEKLHAFDKESVLQRIETIAFHLNDINIQTKLQDMQSNNQTIFYHNNCKKTMNIYMNHS